ncbi:MAG TPA: hypothetical protein VFY10_13380 [Dehalococcoidia bacterium]|nr:hypothetical protein [Dehalococcoidia bacterium]
MLDLSLGQTITLLFGGVLVVIGLTGLAPVALRWHRKTGLSNMYITDLVPALASADAYLRPLVPRFEPIALERRIAAVESPIDTDRITHETPIEAPALAGESDPTQAQPEAVAMAAEELTAQLFAIRMTLSDVTVEVQSVREALGERGILDEFDDVGINLPEVA